MTIRPKLTLKILLRPARLAVSDSKPLESLVMEKRARQQVGITGGLEAPATVCVKSPVLGALHLTVLRPP